MFENLFSPSPQIWTALIGGLVALPILIHLINLMRHQKVEWAAMEFLLKSYKKNRNWVWLKQLLLLLSRIAVLLLALFMLAQIGCNENRIAALLGGETTHHYVLLDDSFSMSDRSTDGTAFDRALATLSLIASRAKNRQNQKFTLMRFSRARTVKTANGQNELASSFADLNGELVDNQFAQLLEDTKQRMQVSNLAVDVHDTLTAAAQLIRQRNDENAIIYILSDFRAKDWNNPERIDQQLAEISHTGAATELITCVKTERPNLTITELGPSGSVRVAGTPLMMKLTVKNASQYPAEKIQIRLETHTFDDVLADGQSPESFEPNVVELPTLFIEKIAAGQTESREFPVYFNNTGQHVIKAMLKNDAIQFDNSHWNVTAVSPSAKVLIVDDQDQLQGRFLALAINPGGMTGLAPEFQTKDFLRDASSEKLQDYDVIYLLDIDRLDETAVKNLESYASSGGGVGFFLGPNTNIAFYNNQLYRNGQGVFPLPLDKAIDIPELIEERIPDIAPEDHPIFPAGMKNPLLDLVQIKRIIQPPVEWLSRKRGETSVAATVRGIQTWPLIVQHRFGQGNVVAFLSTAGPQWNNWSRNGTFPPSMLLIEDLLAKGRYTQSTNLVGIPIQISAEPVDFGPDATLVVPSDNMTENDSAPRFAIKRKMQIDETSQKYEIELGRSGKLGHSSDVATPGIYDVWLQKTDSQLIAQRFALNPDPRESGMAIINQQSMLASLEKSKPTFISWDQFNPAPQQQSTSSVTKLLLLLLIGLLVMEQLFAYSASYHAKTSVFENQKSQLGTSFRKGQQQQTMS